MRTSHARTLLAGVAGGFAMNLMMLLTFRFIGFGVHGEGILLDPDFQSKKLIVVWTELEPSPAGSKAGQKHLYWVVVVRVVV